MANIDHHAALIYTMVLVSAADREMTDAELAKMGNMVLHLPVFRDFDQKKLTKVGAECAKLLQDEKGLDKALRQIKQALPRKLRETAYAFACDVVVADGKVSREELRILAMLRNRLKIGSLPAAAIERAAHARHLTA